MKLRLISVDQRSLPLYRQQPGIGFPRAIKRKYNGFIYIVLFITGGSDTDDYLRTQGDLWPRTHHQTFPVHMFSSLLNNLPVFDWRAVYHFIHAHPRLENSL